MKNIIYILLTLISLNVVGQNDTTKIETEMDSIRSYRIEYMKNYHQNEKNKPSNLRKTNNKIVPVDFDHNTFYGTVGSLIVINSVGIQYERLLWDKGLYLNIGINRMHIKSIPLFGSGTFTTSNLGLTYLVGHSGNFFELGAGGYYLKPSPDIKNDLYKLNLGYRFQSGKGLIFRVGFGVPEGLYLSFGFSF